jgi:hypothetical protein
VIQEDEQLRAIAKWYAPKKLREPGRLGDIITQYVETELAPKHNKNISVEEAWREIVPEFLAPHCRCMGIKQGHVEILIDSPVYGYQLTIRSSELIEQLRQAVPRIRIKAIKTKIGSLKQYDEPGK